MTVRVGLMGLLSSYTPSSQTQGKRYVNMMVQTPKVSQSAWSFYRRVHQPVDEADQHAEEAIFSIGSRILGACLTGLRHRVVGDIGREVRVPTKIGDIGREVQVLTEIGDIGRDVEVGILPRETGGAI